jgi:hypothetical protein
MYDASGADRCLSMYFIDVFLYAAELTLSMFFCSSARKRQKVDGVDGNTSASRRLWRGNSREANSVGRSESYYGHHGPDYYPREGGYDVNRHYGKQYPGDSAAGYGEWGPMQSSAGWYDDYQGDKGYSGPAWGGETQSGYRDYYPDAETAMSRQYSDGGTYSYPSLYRSSSVDRKHSVPSSSGYFRNEEYYGDRYSGGFGGFRGAYSNTAQEGGVGVRGGYQSGRFGVLSTGTNATSRYATTFKARQYSFGAKKATSRASVGPRGGAAAGAGPQKVQAVKVEPEKPRIITGKRFLSLAALLAPVNT